MMINKRLIGTVKESKKYIALNVAIQWCSLAANVVMMAAISVLLASMAEKNVTRTRIYTTIIIAAAAVVIRFLCAVGMSKMSYLSSKAVKKTLREKIYEKLLKLGTSYQEKVQTSEVVQVAVEGVDQLETYFGAYLPQFLCNDCTAYFICDFMFYKCSVCGCTSYMRSAYTCCDSGCADMGKKTSQ